MLKLVAYYRVSTAKQGESGLGLEGQVAAVLGYARSVGGEAIKEFKEVESGRKSDRPELAKALEHARLTGATLCVAKLDRLSRNVAFLSALMESGTPFVCCDNPHATPMTIHILVAVAEGEAKMISARTKAALAAYKEGKRVSRRVQALYPKGVPAKVVRETAGKLGGALPTCRNLSPAARDRGRALAAKRVKAEADRNAASLGPVVRQLRADGLSLKAVALELNARRYITRSGKPWHAVAVLRLLNRVKG